MNIHSMPVPGKKSVDRARKNKRTLRLKPSTIGGAFLHRRYRVDPHLADLLAEIAGLGAQEAAR